MPNYVITFTDRCWDVLFSVVVEIHRVGILAIARSLSISEFCSFSESWTFRSGLCVVEHRIGGVRRLSASFADHHAQAPHLSRVFAVVSAESHKGKG